MKLRLNARMLKTGLLALIFLALLLGGAWLLHAWEEGRGGPAVHQDMPMEDAEDGQAQIYYHGAWYAPRDGLETVLFLGLDRAEDIPVNGEYAQSDAVLLMVLDRRAKTRTLFHLNRDTMVEIQDFNEDGGPNGSYTAQLALAYAHAQARTGDEKTAARAAMDAVSGLLYGVEIAHYVTLTMDGVIVLNDLAGGVTVEITDDFSAIDDTLVQGETVTLLGQHALNYVRNRWWVGDSSNLERMERQSGYLEALQEKLSDLAEQDEGFALSSLLAVNDYMTSDLTVQQLARLAEEIRGLNEGGAFMPEGEARLGEPYVEFYPDENLLQRLVIEVFYEPIESP